MVKKPKQKQYCNKFNKDFKNAPHQKKSKKKKDIIKEVKDNLQNERKYLQIMYLIRV